MNVNCFHLSVWKTAEGHLFTNVTVGPGGYSNPPVDFPDARFVLSHPLVFQEKSGMENDEFDESRFADWVKQASKLPLARM